MTMKIHVTSIVISFLVLIAFCDLFIFGYKITSRSSETSNRSKGDEKSEKVDGLVEKTAEEELDDTSKEEKQMAGKDKDVVKATEKTLDEGPNDEKNEKEEVSEHSKDDKQESKKMTLEAIQAIAKTVVREKVAEALEDESKNNKVARTVKMALKQILAESPISVASLVTLVAKKKLAEGASDERQEKTEEMVEKDTEKLDGVSKNEQRGINKEMVKLTPAQAELKDNISKFWDKTINDPNNDHHYTIITVIMVAVRQKVFEALEDRDKDEKIGKLIMHFIKQKFDEEPGLAKKVKLVAQKILASTHRYPENEEHNLLDDIKPEKFNFEVKIIFNAVKDKLDDVLNEKHNNVKGIVQDAVRETLEDF